MHVCIRVYFVLKIRTVYKLFDWIHVLEKCSTIINDSVFEKSNHKVYSLSSQDYQNQNGEIFFTPLKSSGIAKKKKK